MRHLRSLVVVLLFSLLTFSVIHAQEAPLKVVVTYSILGDLVQNVAGDSIELTVLVGPDGDLHVYEPTPQDAVALAEADLIFENGLEFETWLDDLYTASGSTTMRIVVSDGIEPLAFEEHDDEHEHEGEGHGGFMEGAPMVGTRLIVNDYESGTVQIVDLRTNEVIAGFELTARASLYPSPNGRYAFAVQTDGGITNLLDSGVSAVPHDDHFDTDFGSPALLGTSIEGATPVHYTPHHDQIAIFHDGDGAATIFTEAGLFAGETVTVTAARPHHGVAVPMGDVVLMSAPNMENADDSLPVGVDVMTLDGAILQSIHECPGLHGEAAYSDDGVAFGCSDGVLLVERDGETFISRKVTNPTENPDLRTGTLYAVEGADYLLGNYGQNTLVRVDPVAATSEIVIEAPARIWRFSFHGEDPSKLVALTIDGNLHVIDIASGEIEGTVQVVDPFLAPTSGRAAARPTFIVNGHMAYVSEPLPGDIRGVNLETLEIAEERIFVGGKPSALAVFGMAAESALGEHDHEDEAHDHEHEDEVITDLSPWNGSWISTRRYSDLPEMQSAYATIAEIVGVSVEEAEAFIHSVERVEFDEMIVADGSVTYIDGDAELTCAYQLVGEEEALFVGVPFGTWYLWETNDPACELYRYLVATPMHSGDFGDVPNFHIRYGSTSFDDLIHGSENATWFATLGPAALTEAVYVESYTVNAEGWAAFMLAVRGDSAMLDAILAGGEDESEAQDHEHGEFDPHIWHDPNNAVVMVENIRAALVEADATNADAYNANAEAYTTQLSELDATIRELVASIPEAQRILVTSHDTFGYFGDEYGFEISSALASVSTESADPSAGEIAELIGFIQAEGVPAIFAENIANPDLMQRIADESGAILAPTLYTDALGQTGTPGATYLEMMRYNIDIIAAALQ